VFLQQQLRKHFVLLLLPRLTAATFYLGRNVTGVSHQRLPQVPHNSQHTMKHQSQQWHKDTYSTHTHTHTHGERESPLSATCWPQQDWSSLPVLGNRVDTGTDTWLNVSDTLAVSGRVVTTFHTCRALVLPEGAQHCPLCARIHWTQSSWVTPHPHPPATGQLSSAARHHHTPRRTAAVANASSSFATPFHVSEPAPSASICPLRHSLAALPGRQQYKKARAGGLQA
jgi:hypothetical protein